VFVGGYLLIWALFGVLAYLIATGADGLAARAPWLMMNGPRIAGVALIGAGLYQLSPLKRVCLTRCRTPMQFILTAWRDGMGGALRMGMEHGVFCLGCCWWLMIALFPLGVMNVAAMGLLTALIFAEKCLPVGRLIAWLAAGALIAFGALVVIVPAALPGTMG
jgi:predicted metal-binding membrane protein